MQHGRACGRVSASKALGLRCGSRSQLRAMIPCLLLRVRVNIYIYVDGWMGIYCPARRFLWRGICRRWSSFSLLFASLSLPLPLPSLSHYRDCCVCVNCFSFLGFPKHSTAQHNATMAPASDVEKGPEAYSTPSPDLGPTKSHDGTKQRRRSSAVVNGEVLVTEINDDRFESTQRGLKSRHAQMIALGGTM